MEPLDKDLFAKLKSMTPDARKAFNTFLQAETLAARRPSDIAGLIVASLDGKLREQATRQN